MQLTFKDAIRDGIYFGCYILLAYMVAFCGINSFLFMLMGAYHSFGGKVDTVTLFSRIPLEMFLLLGVLFVFSSILFYFLDSKLDNGFEQRFDYAWKELEKKFYKSKFFNFKKKKVVVK